MPARHTAIVIALWSLLQLGCASVPEGLFPPAPGEPTKPVYLVSHGWHAGIVVRRADIPPGVWPQSRDFPDAEYLEVGWGDRDYYMTRRPHIGHLLKAGLLPTDSVLQVVGFNGPVERYFPRSEVVRIDLSEAGFERLVRYIEQSHLVDAAGRVQALGRSLYGRGGFYLSRETYHLFNTCNAWTARALREAGCPITPAANLLVETLMSNLARCGTVIRARAEDASESNRQIRGRTSVTR